MPYIPPDVVAKAREMDLFTYLRNYEPQELVHFSGNTYCTRTHDSLKISNGKWCWFSRGIGGTSALDYLIKVKGVPFMDAVQQITGKAAVQPPVFVPTVKNAPQKVLLLPKPSYDSTQAVSYLTGRGIDPDLVDYCISSGRLYESYPHHNVVFLGLDKTGRPRYANLRGIGTNFIGDANGSDKHFSFGIPARGKSDTLHLFESAIDLLSYGTLLKQMGRDWRQDNLLSLAGVYRPRSCVEDSTLPVALKQHLEDCPHIKHVILRLDNDPAGRLAAATIKTLLEKQHDVSAQIRPPPQGKDYNDFLCLRRGLPIIRRSTRQYER